MKLWGNRTNHLHLLQKVTLMKNCEFCEDVSKSKQCKSCIMNYIPRLKCLVFLCFWVEWCKPLAKDGQEIIISTRMKKFNFWVKYAGLIKNENEILKNSDFWYTWSHYHIQQVFQISERTDQYFSTGVASQQGTLTLPDTWFRPPFWDLLMLQLLRPNSSNLPCLYSTFHLEYPLVLSRFYLVDMTSYSFILFGISLYCTVLAHGVSPWKWN